MIFLVRDEPAAVLILTRENNDNPLTVITPRICFQVCFYSSLLLLLFFAYASWRITAACYVTI